MENAHYIFVIAVTMWLEIPRVTWPYDGSEGTVQYTGAMPGWSHTHCKFRMAFAFMSCCTFQLSIPMCRDQDSPGGEDKLRRKAISSQVR